MGAVSSIVARIRSLCVGANPREDRLFLYCAGLAVAWTLLIAASLIWNVSELRKSIVDLSRAEARGAYEKEVAYRHWATSHGGVYVPVTEDTPPNPYLEGIPERDITTPAGKRLTLMNPAYMTRQVFEMSGESDRSRARITSLNPLNPVNAPDPWEEKALKVVEAGAEEFSEIAVFNGVECMRFMRPLIVEAPCLKCHARQGYRAGDLRGGISVAVPIAPYRAVAGAHVRREAGAHAVLWIIGLVIMVAGKRYISRSHRERESTMAVLRESEEGYRQLAVAVEWADISIAITKRSGLIEYVNPCFERVTGYSRRELVGQNPRILKSGTHDAAFYKKMWGVLVSRNVWRGVLVNKKKDGTIYYEDTIISPVLDKTGAIVNYVSVKRDISREKALEEQLRHAQKMEAVGQLAGGVAHDFNNVLTAILGFSEIMLDEMKEGDPWRRFVEPIRQSGERGAGIVRQLLAFSRKQVVQPRVLDMNSVVSGMDRMIRRLLGEDVSMHIALAPDECRVFADQGQIEQVIMNLAVNARDAMAGGGKLTIGTRCVELDEAYAESHSEVKPGPYVELAVSDTGHGMDAETQARIFEPFFTTKELGKGTGLGLSTLYGIVNQSGGHIWVYSEVGVGTTFKIHLPLSSRPREMAPEVSAPAATIGGSESILVVEDDGAVLDFVARSLTARGYSVLTAKNGKEAEELVGSNGHRIDLLLTDVVMPGVSGFDLALRLGEMHPGLKVLYMSGYADAALRHRGVIVSGEVLLEKPFTVRVLAESVRRALDI